MYLYYRQRVAVLTLSSCSRGYIEERLNLFASSGDIEQFEGALSGMLRGEFVDLVYSAHTFYLENFDHGAVSQREITRIFKLLPFFWNLRTCEGGYHREPNRVLRRCMFSAIALV